MNSWICSLNLGFYKYKLHQHIHKPCTLVSFFRSLERIHQKTKLPVQVYARNSFCMVELVIESFIRTGYNKVFCGMFFCCKWGVCNVVSFISMPDSLKLGAGECNTSL